MSQNALHDLITAKNLVKSCASNLEYELTNKEGFLNRSELQFIEYRLQYAVSLLDRVLEELNPSQEVAV